ncbi:hypothetical protein Scep_003857 [Stephania cephalantha]|uniref:Uncharacterized protein n=1 Tax=Stephania cephalantha TaxID=152367 RepID=A0AAP0PUV6_9MAGN
METTMAELQEGGDGSDSGSQYTVSAEDFHKPSNKFAVQGQQLADFISDMTMRMSAIGQYISTATISIAIVSTPEAHVVTTNDMQRWTDTVTARDNTPELSVAPTILIPPEILFVVVPIQIWVDATPALTEDNRNRKRGKGLKNMPEGSSSSGFEILVTTIVPCVHTSALAHAVASRLLSMLPNIMVSPTFVPDFVIEHLRLCNHYSNVSKLRVVETNLHWGYNRDSF